MGLEGITRALAEGLRGKRSWHGLSTQVVDFDYGDDGAGDGDGDGDGAMAVRARASSYLQGTFFGMGNLTGQIVTTYGRYVVAFFLYSFLCYVMLCYVHVWSGLWRKTRNRLPQSASCCNWFLAGTDVTHSHAKKENLRLEFTNPPLITLCADISTR